MIKFTNLTPPRGESHPENHIRDLNHIRDMTTYDVRDLGDGPWRKQLGGVNLKEKYFFFLEETRGDTRRGERKEEMLCRKKLDVSNVTNGRFWASPYVIPNSFRLHSNGLFLIFRCTDSYETQNVQRNII